MHYLQAVFDAVYGCRLKKIDDKETVSDNPPDILLMLWSSMCYGVVYSLSTPVQNIPSMTAMDLIQKDVLQKMRLENSFSIYALYNDIEIKITFEKFKGWTTRVFMESISPDMNRAKNSAIESFINIIYAMSEEFHCRRFGCAIKDIECDPGVDDYDER